MSTEIDFSALREAGQRLVDDGLPACQIAVARDRELIMFEGRPFRSAGTVNESERFTCPQCPWSARIDKNRVWPV